VLAARLTKPVAVAWAKKGTNADPHEADQDRGQ